MKRLMNMKVFVAVLAATSLIALLMAVPTRSGIPAGQYDPWLDVNDDGKIDIRDIARVAKAFGTSGQNISKASLDYDSGWVNITGMAGQYFSVTHGLNSLDLMVDISGKTTVDGGVHQKYFGGTDFVAGWNKTYGGTSYDYAFSVVQTSDGGYALAGSTKSFGAGGSDVWLVKTDADGNMQWNKTYGGTEDDTYVVSMVQTNDKGYAIATATSSFGAGQQDFWLIKVDWLGITQWNRTYGGPNYDFAKGLVQTSDGGYAILGTTESYGAGGQDFWLVRTDSAGVMQWNKTYGGASTDGSESIVQTGDGGYALAGLTYSFGAGDCDAWLIKVDAVGGMQWNKTYGTAGGESACSLIQTFDGGYAMAGGQNYGWWLVKVDAVGNMQWNHHWATAGGTESANCLIQDSDGGYTLVGQTSGPSDMRLIKTDGRGNDIWSKDYGGTGYDFGYWVIRTADGGYALAGETGSFGAGLNDIWLVKTDAAGNALDGFKYGLAMVGSTLNTVDLYRGTDDEYWNYVRVQIWAPR
jgi:hypothetical protein